MVKYTFTSTFIEIRGANVVMVVDMTLVIRLSHIKCINTKSCADYSEID